MSSRARWAALVIAALLVSPASAAAAEPVYTVHSCRTPQGTASSLEGWTVERRNASLSRSTDDCPRGGPFSIELRSGVTHPSNDYIRTTFRAPPDTEIRNYTIWRSFEVTDVYHVWSSEFRLGTYVTFDRCFAEHGCTGAGNQDDPLGPSNLAGGIGRTGVTRLDFNVTCGHVDSGGSICSSASPTGRFRLHRADIALLDQYPPALAAAPAGPLLAGGPLSGVQGVAISATDRGGGVYKALAEVDGQIVAEAVLDRNGGRCTEPFGAARPCKPSATGLLALDTATVPDGTHSLRLLVTDAAGSVAAWGPVSIRTANSACALEPSTDAVSLRAWLGHRRGRRQVTVDLGRRVVARGRLTDSAGQPVAAAPVCVVTRAAGATVVTESVTTVVTDARGRFQFRVGTGMSRRVWFIHRTSVGAASANVGVGVRAPVRLRLSRPWLRTGETLALTGRVGGDPRPRAGVLVELQARRDGRWQTFSTTRARRNGRFRDLYRFTRTTGVQRYRLRARVPGQSEYPYAPGGSRPASVTVYGY